MGIDPLPYSAGLGEYQRQAESLLDGVTSGNEGARWAFKWLHPRFRDRPVAEVDGATLAVTDAQTVIARHYAFETWPDLVAFTESVARDNAVERFEAAVEAVVSGDLQTLRSLLREHPALARARSSRRHHATLLHYVGANGVEDGRQKTPGNVVDVATTLLDAGAEVDALADMYDATCTTMSMVVSSAHPAEVGVQAALAGTLLDYGAAFEGPGSNWTSALMTALAFGYLATAQALVSRGAPVNSLEAASGLGRLDDAQRLLPTASSDSRHIAVALAAQHGQVPVLRVLLDAGENPDRYNPHGYHAHSTPLHQAVWAGHDGVVQLLVERGARLDIVDTIYDGTPLAWATYGGRTEVAAYLTAAADRQADNERDQIRTEGV